MNYRDLNDNEILSYIAEANGEAEEVLYKKYEPLIRSIANKMYTYCKNNGTEISDLIQEGMLGLNQAIATYKDNKDASFFTYAKTCIERRIITLVVSSNRLKHKALNSSLSFDKEFDDEEGSKLEFLVKDNSANPEELLISSEAEEEIIDKVRSALTEFEMQVFDLKLNFLNYREIADILDKDPKVIDNAIQRIRNKAKKIINK